MFKRSPQDPNQHEKRRRLNGPVAHEPQPRLPMEIIDENLRVLALRLKESRRLMHEAAFIEEVNETFHDLSQLIFETKGAAYIEWEGRTHALGKLISFHIYNLGLLAQVGREQFDISIIEFILTRLERLPVIEAKYIANAFYGIGLLAKEKRLFGQLDSRFTCVLLDKLISCPEIDGQAISYVFYGLGFLARSNLLTDPLDTNLITDFLVKLLYVRYLQPNHVSYALYNLGFLANSNLLDAQIDARLISELFVSLLQFSAIDSQVISFSLSGVGLLALKNGLRGQINASIFNELLLNLVQSRNLDSQAIDSSLNALGHIASSNALAGQIHPPLMADLLLFLLRSRNLDVKCICNSIYGVSFLVAGRLEPTAELAVILNQLLPSLFAKRMLELDADRVLSALGRLMPGAACSGEALVELFKTIMARSYTHPNFAAKLIHHMVVFKHHNALLDEQFNAVLSAITMKLNQFPAPLQAQLQADIAALTDIRPWRLALLRALGESPVVENRGSSSHNMLKLINEATVPHLLTVPTRTARPVPTMPSSVPAMCRLERAPVAPIAPSLPRVQPIPTAVSITTIWNRAREFSPVFDAIAAEDINQLQQLLGGIQARKCPRVSVVSSERRVSPILANILRNEERTNEKAHTDAMVTVFLQETEALALKALIQRSSFEYFELLFRACSQHARYQLAINNAMHAILLYLPLKELSPMVVSLLGMGLYRDHDALLNLVDALNIRLSTHSEMPGFDAELIVNLRTKLLSRALEFHETSDHYRVVERLNNKINQFDRAQNHSEKNDFEAYTLPAKKAVVLTAQSKAPTFGTQSLLFAPSKAQRHEPNLGYEYTSEDIQAILRARLNPYLEADESGVILLGAAHMDAQAQGNRVIDILSDYVAHDGVDSMVGKKVILPINLGHHWVGITLEVDSSHHVVVTYHNSAKNPVTDHALQMTIMQELASVSLHGQSIFNGGGTIQFNHRCLQQQDGTSCGAFLIENIYSDIKRAQWIDDQPERSIAERIRARHMEVLALTRPDYYPQFLQRQQVFSLQNSARFS